MLQCNKFQTCSKFCFTIISIRPSKESWYLLKFTRNRSCKKLDALKWILHWTKFRTCSKFFPNYFRLGLQNNYDIFWNLSLKRSSISYVHVWTYSNYGIHSELAPRAGSWVTLNTRWKLTYLTGKYSMCNVFFASIVINCEMQPVIIHVRHRCIHFKDYSLYQGSSGIAVFM